jgi:hypothetical protein
VIDVIIPMILIHSLKVVLRRCRPANTLNT